MTGEEKPPSALRRGLETLARWAAFLWLQVGLMVLLFLLINALAGVAVRWVQRDSTIHPAPEREAAYNYAPWTAAYFARLRHTQMRWFPYSYWRSVPLSAAGLNVDREGNRVTWHPPANARGRKVRIWMFGGSTMWGDGVRDDYTLPSLMAQRLTAAGYVPEITNLGQIGYASTQEVIMLMQALRAGPRPDLVIFYDGVNDCFAAYQDRIAGLTVSEFNRVREFSLLSTARHRKALYRIALQTLIGNSSLGELTRWMAGKDIAGYNQGIDPSELMAYLAPPGGYQRPEALQQAVVDDYLFNQRIVEGWARDYGFHALFYWQPLVYTKDTPAPLEREFMTDSVLRQFITGIYQRMGAVAARAGVVDLSATFNHHPEIDYIDSWHLTEAGNRVIAESMSRDALPMLAALEPGATPAAK